MRMRCWRFGLSVVLLAGVAAGQRVKAPATTAPVVVHHGRIHGVVLCSDTQKPARGATVMLFSRTGTLRGSAMTLVGLDGTYSADLLAAGEYVVVALYQGYRMPFDEMAIQRMLTEMRDGEKAAKLGPPVVVHGEESVRHDLVLERGAAISGTVVYSDGSPAGQTSIAVEEVSDKDARKDAGISGMTAGMLMALVNRTSLITDDRGRFRVVGLAAGKYRVAAVAAPVGQNAGDIDDDDGFGGMAALLGNSAGLKVLRVYSGDTVHRNEAKVYEVTAGSELTGIAITIPVDLVHQVEGQVTAKDGRTLNMGRLTLTDLSDEWLVFEAKVTRDGRFRFHGVPPGTYKLAVAGARIGRMPTGGRNELPEDAMLAPVNAFADASMSVIVTDRDVNDVGLALDEIALPKENPGEGDEIAPKPN